MAWLGDLLIRLKAETADFQQDLGKAAYAVDKAARQMERSLKSVDSAMKLIGGSLVVGGMAKFVKNAIDNADAMGNMAEKAQMNVEQFSALSYAYKQLDVSQESLQVGTKQLNKTIAEAAAGVKDKKQALDALGVSYKNADGSARDTLAVMLDLAKVFSNAKDDPTKVAYAMKLMGKSGEEMLLALDKGPDKIRELMGEARDLGIVIGGDLATQANEFNKKLEKLETGSAALGISLANDLLPRLTKVADEMLRAKKEGGGLAMLWEGLKSGSFAAIFGTDEETAASRLVGYTEQYTNALAQADRAATAFGYNSAIAKGYRDQAEEARKAAEQARTYLNLIQNGLNGPAPSAKAGDKPKKALPTAGLGDAGAAAREAAARAKLYISSLQELEEKAGKLNGLSEEEIVTNRLLGGSWETIYEEHGKELINIAKDIDQRQQLIKRMELAEKAITEESAAIEAQQKIRQDAFTQYKDFIDQQEFEITLIGKSAREQQRMNALRQVDLELRQQVRAVADAAGDNPDALAKGTQDAIDLANRKRDAIIDSANRRLEAERRWSTGAADAFNDYIDHATNAAEQARTLFTDAFQGMEDALVSFVKTGKLDFTSLADSIITDIIRIQIRQAMAGVLGGSGGPLNIASALGNIFMPGSAGGGALQNGSASLSSGSSGLGLKLPSYDVGTDYVPHDMVAQIHKGEKITPASQNHDSGGNQYVIYAQGADVGAVERIEHALMVLAGPGVVERRAQATTFSDFRGRGAMRRAL